MNKNNNTSRFQQQTWSFHPGQHVTSSLWNSAEETWHYNASGFQPESRICQQTWGHHMAVQQFGQFRAVHRQEFKARRLRSQCRWIAIDMKNCEAGPSIFPANYCLEHIILLMNIGKNNIISHRTRGCNYFGPKFKNNNPRKRKHNLNWEDVYIYIYVCVCVFVYISLSYEYRYIQISLSG